MMKLRAWAYHFGNLPATITAFRPQTITWLRDDEDGPGTLAWFLEDEFKLPISGGIAQASLGGTQGSLIFTATTIGVTNLAQNSPLTYYGAMIVPASAGAPTGYRFFTTEQIMAVSPRTKTTPPPTPSAKSPPLASDSNTSGSNSLRAEIIGGQLGGGAFILVLVVIFLFLLRRRSKQSRGEQYTHKVTHAMTLFATDRQLQDSYRAAAVIHPFPPTAPVLESSPERKEPPSTAASNFPNTVEVSNPRMTEPAGGEQTIDPQQPDAEPDGREGGETSTLGNDNQYRTMQA
ncbi:hypothetical protein PQX77_012324 [Marasmius sp. AFHP31]|nr:hypothetical protein PQX77_012324 [Marasmius sp. AFHP31]